MKEKLFLDTNIVIYLLGERASYYGSIAKIATLADLTDQIIDKGLSSKFKDF